MFTLRIYYPYISLHLFAFMLLVYVCAAVLNQYPPPSTNIAPSIYFFDTNTTSLEVYASSVDHIFTYAFSSILIFFDQLVEKK